MRTALRYGTAAILLAGYSATLQAQTEASIAGSALPNTMADAPANPVQPDKLQAVQLADLAGLPDAPGMVSSSMTSPVTGDASALQTASSLAKSTPRTAGKYDTVILPGQTAAKLTAHDKVVFGIKDSISPISLFGWVLSASYEQVVDGSPNYGVINNTQTGKSYAQRLGAAAARDTSETIFSESILAPILHEDPRYYAQTNRNFFYRVIYAGTRPIFTRTDGGRTTINLSQLGGNLAGSALTPAYYPPLNRDFNQVLQTFGGSIGGSALADLGSEFLPGLLEAFHFKKKL